MTFGFRFGRSAAARLAAAAGCSLTLLLSLSLADMPAGSLLPARVMAQESGVSVSGAPAVPAPVTPEDGAVYPSWAETPPFAWEPVEGAGDYQVVINGGERTSPWLGRARWAAGDLGEGTFTWQVQARSQGGISQPSPAWTFIVSSDAAASAPVESAPAEPEVETEAGRGPNRERESELQSEPESGSIAEPAAEGAPAEDAASAPDAAPAAAPAEADAAASVPAPAPTPTPTLALDAASPLVVGQPLTLTGAGFTPGEAVTVRWLGDQGPVMGTSSADDRGGFTFSLDVPSTPIGDRPVVAIGESDGKQAVAWYVIAPTLAVAPAEARPGDPVTVTLLGYGPDEEWQVRWGGEDGEVWQTGRTDANGAATLEAAAPELAAGEHPLAGLGVASGGRAGAAFTLLDRAASEGDVAVLSERPADERAPEPEPAAEPAPEPESEPSPEPAPGQAPEAAEVGEAAPPPAAAPVLESAAAPRDDGGPPDVTMNEGVIAAPPASEVETTASPDSTAHGDAKPGRDRKQDADPSQDARGEKKAIREANKVAIANEMRVNFGMPPIPEETPTAGQQSSGALGEDVSVEASGPPEAALNGYIDPGASAPGSPAAEPAREIAAAQEVAPAREPDGALAVPGAVYDLLPNPEALGVVEREPRPRPSREPRDHEREREDQRKERDRDPDRAGEGDGDGQRPDSAPEDAPPPSDDAVTPPEDLAPSGDASDPAPDPSPEPEAPAPPPGTVLVFMPAADTSVGAGAPDDPQPEAQVTVLPLGGPDSAAAYLTFDLSGIGGGKVARATLTITGAVGFWGPVAVSAVPGYWADEATLTWNGAPGGEIAATTRAGDPSGYPELPAGGTVSADVTGVIAGDGTVTFVLRGTPDAGQAIGSRESDIPAVLEIVTG